MPYRAILALACILLAVRYVVDAEASPGWRWTVGVLTVASLWFRDSQLFALNTASVVTQLAVCLFVLLRQKAMLTK